MGGPGGTSQKPASGTPVPSASRSGRARPAGTPWNPGSSAF